MCLNAAKIISVSIFLAAGRKLVKNLKYTKKALAAEPWPQASCTETVVKFEYAVFEIREQADKQPRCSQYFAPHVPIISTTSR